MRSLLRAVALAAAMLSPLLAAPGQAVAAPPDAPSPPGLDIGTGAKEPIEISADEGIEWRREEHLVIARGNALVRQGKVEVHAPVLAAYYRETPQGKNEVYRFDARNGVVITADGNKVTGDNGVYLLDKDVMVLHGPGLKLETPNQVITAKDTLEYYNGKQMAVARGDAIAARGDQRLRADVLVAHLDRAQSGKSAIRQIDAVGGVVISTRTDVVRAERGEYNVQSEIATLTGGVKITRGKDQLEGATAQTNMRTGVSSIVAAKGGRVRALFMPGPRGEQPLPLQQR